MAHVSPAALLVSEGLHEGAGHLWDSPKISPRLLQVELRVSPKGCCGELPLTAAPGLFVLPASFPEEFIEASLCGFGLRSGTGRATFQQPGGFLPRSFFGRARE